MQVTPAFKTAAKDSGMGSSASQHPKAIKTEENARDNSVVQNDRVLGPSVSHSDTVVQVSVLNERPRHHVYSNTSSDGKDEKNAAISADIRNYSEPGEDLDWTKVSGPTERKRFQGIIGGRKYRERRLASQGKIGSGGNYPGAAGEGSYLSTGYGPQPPYGYSKSKSPQPLTTSATPVNPRDHSTSTPGTLLHKALGIPPGSSVPPLTGSKVSRHSLPATNSSREPVVYHGLDEQSGDYWNHGHSANAIERAEGAPVEEASESLVITSNDRQEAHAKTRDQGGYENFLQSLMDSVTP